MSNTFVNSFTHLKGRPRADQALSLLQRITSLVKPIMRKHGWVLPVLAEFFPESPNLVGLNINSGQKILLRLRPAHAPDTFYDDTSIAHTMLHELTHNVHGPHDEKFYKFLSGLEEEYDVLQRSGYAGEGFFSAGYRVGTNISHNVPPHLARQRALEAAEKRRHVNLILSGGGPLGGVQSKKSPRELAAEAAERRVRDEKACASGAVAQREAEKAAKESIVDEVIDLTNDSDSEPDIVVLNGYPSDTGASKTSASNRAISRAQRSAAQSSRDHATHTSVTPESTASNPSTKLPERSSSLEPWSCAQCTLTNDGQVPRCAACDFPHPNTTQRISTREWTCHVCGETSMPAELWSCRFCGTVKSHS